MLPWYQAKDNFIINTDCPFPWKEYWASMKSHVLALFPNILAPFSVTPALFVPWIFQGSFWKPYAEEDIYSFQPCHSIIKTQAYTSKLQLFLQPKLFQKGDIIYNIFRGNSQPCLAILQELYRWRIPFFFLNSLTHNKREKQDPRTLSFKTTYYLK